MKYLILKDFIFFSATFFLQMLIFDVNGVISAISRYISDIFSSFSSKINIDEKENQTTSVCFNQLVLCNLFNYIRYRLVYRKQSYGVILHDLGG